MPSFERLRTQRAYSMRAYSNDVGCGADRWIALGERFMHESKYRNRFDSSVADQQARGSLNATHSDVSVKPGLARWKVPDRPSRLVAWNATSCRTHD